MANELPDMGKITPEIFDELIYPRLGRPRRSVLVGPKHGVDIGVVDIGGGRVMAMTTDPVFIVPEYGFERAAWFAIHILCSDAVTSALAPTYLSIDLTLPLEMTKAQLETVWTVIDAECKKMGLAVVCGHTARYDGCHYPMVGGATVISIGEKSRYVTPQMARRGDLVIITKGAAIEATGIFALAFKDRIRDSFGEAFSRRAEKIFYQMSVVEDALTAASVGTREKGVTAMHDATECGVWGGLYEVAKASRVGMRIEKDKIIVLDEVEKICAKFGMDPYSAISEGTLIITCKEAKVGLILKKLARKGIPASIVGEVIPEARGIVLVEKGKERPLEHPRVDPFWPAFAKALAAAKR
ncbi:MAG: AIR synthase [Candidatus Aminicenantes bacterium RBG_16_63_16]|nr:MAG: AIR synthase [Candidatus Aminicenantes bacterium RBG_16_63_16]